jgi:hypothetical protein
MTAYTGICRIGSKEQNVVTDVQVKDPFGNSLPLPIYEYQRRNVKPEYSTLPWCDELAWLQETDQNVR